MEWIMNYLISISVMAEYCSFYYIVFRPPFRWAENKKRVFLVGAFLFFMGILHYLFRGLPGEKIGLVSAFAAVILLFQVPFWKMLKCFLGVLCTLSLAASSCEFMLDSIAGVSGEQTILTVYVAELCVSWAIYLIMFRRKLDTNAFSMDGSLGIWLLIHYFVIILMVTNFQYVLRYEVYTEAVRVTGSLFAGVGGILISISFFVLLYYINMKRNYMARLRTMELLKDQQRHYFNGLLEKEEKTRKFRHDYLAQQVIMSRYLEEGDCERAKQYFRQMVDAFDTAVGRYHYTVGNELVDTILQYYLQKVREGANIVVLGMVGELPEIEERDLTVMVSNLVRNAVEAVEEIEQGERMIRIECRHTQQEFQILVQNSMPAEGLPGNRRGLLIKGEPEHEGLGLVNLRETAEKYDGSIYYTSADGIFQIRLWIPLEG